ncbi:hypothetical protein [Galactobacter caseinivorans]|uniref:Uncharacterized protein n=1 Tax=Galactobacter caseinivorans TaxID=2676123 RepID=A0A496PIT9_9MICC|nr:hypothetical protein [Galactobacter caseinivorans]RKW70421.1 hypothetical protein DWQ67_08035 [Galactobacter caseinivorans]
MSQENQGEYVESDGMQRLEEDESTGSYVDENLTGDGEQAAGERHQGEFTQMQDADGEFEGEELREAGSYTDANEE